MKDIRRLIKLFEQYAHGEQYATAFSNLLDYFLIPFKYYENEEAQDMAVNQLISYDKRDLHIAVMTEIGELSEGFEDVLGELYEQLISKGHNGQFFSPSPIAELIASLVAVDKLRSDGTVVDSACGSGRLLLSAAKRNRHLRFYGADVDSLCCKMSVVNMIMNSLTGEIAHMNTLSNEFYRGYTISTILKDNHHYPFYIEFTDPERSYIWLQPPSQPSPFTAPLQPPKFTRVKGVQGDLFNHY